VGRGSEASQFVEEIENEDDPIQLLLSPRLWKPQYGQPFAVRMQIERMQIEISAAR